MQETQSGGDGRYTPTYRAAEVRTLAGWVQASTGGSVVGLTGCGKSNLFQFLAQRPQALRQHLDAGAPPTLVLLLDLNDLVEPTLSNLYRLIMRTFYEARRHLPHGLEVNVAAQYIAQRQQTDAFLLQSELRELLRQCAALPLRVVLLLDRFDAFFELVSPALIDALRGLRDAYKETLCYIVAMRQPVTALGHPEALGELTELLDLHTLWLGPMQPADSRDMIHQQPWSLGKRPSPARIERLLALTGGFPALLKAALTWLQAQSGLPSGGDWEAKLHRYPALANRLMGMWAGLDEQEQEALHAIASGRPRPAVGAARNGLVRKGVLRLDEEVWRIQGELLAMFARENGRLRAPQLWLDETSGDIYMGSQPLRELSPLAHAVLTFLLRHPRQRHTKTDIILGAWPKALRQHGVTDDSLYQVIRELRKQVEPVPASPKYLLTWRGRPEGGYQLFPGGS